jgi:hypothetical protein
VSYAGRALPVTFIARAASTTRVHKLTILFECKSPEVQGLPVYFNLQQKSCHSPSAVKALIVD